MNIFWRDFFVTHSRFFLGFLKLNNLHCLYFCNRHNVPIVENLARSFTQTKASIKDVLEVWSKHKNCFWRILQNTMNGFYLFWRYILVTNKRRSTSDILLSRNMNRDTPPFDRRYIFLYLFLPASGSVIPIADIRGSDSLNYGKGEKILRCKLASCYRLVDLHGWSNGIRNHITVSCHF